MKNYRYKRGAALTMAAVMTWGSVVTASAEGAKQQSEPSLLVSDTANTLGTENLNTEGVLESEKQVSSPVLSEEQKEDSEKTSDSGETEPLEEHPDEVEAEPSEGASTSREKTLEVRILGEPLPVSREDAPPEDGEHPQGQEVKRELAEGSYTASVAMYKNGKNDLSMCDALFAARSDVEVRGDTATIKLYVAFQKETAGIGSASITYNGEVYEAELDTTKKNSMKMKKDMPLMLTRYFGFLKQGQEVQAEVLTIELPKAALEEGKRLGVSAHVNAMGSDQKFDMELSDWQKKESSEPENHEQGETVSPEPEQPEHQEPDEHTETGKPESPVNPVPPAEPELPVEKPVANKGMIAITMNQDNEEKPSMCNPLFAAKGDVEIRGDMATLKLYVAYPIPNFASDGEDGTLKNVSITYQGKQYEAESDITTKPLMVARESNKTFGLTAGQELPAQILTFKLPKAALEEKKLDIKAYVNVFMNSDQDFDMCLSDLQLTEITKPAKPIVAVEAEITNKTEDGISASIKNVNIQTGDKEAGKVSVTAMTSDANAGTVKKSTITLPKENAKKLSNNNVALEVQTNQATVTLDKHVVDIIAEKDKDVILSVEKHPNVQGGYTDAYSLELMADNEKVDFSGGNVVVTVKSELSNGWAHHIVDNKPASSYKLTKNPDGTVSWKTNHFSDWALSADNKAPNAQPEMNGSSGSHSTSGNNSSTSDNNNSASDKESRQDIVDGNYYVDVTLIKSNKNEKSMGDVAFEKNRQALVTFRNGKVDKVQMSSNPVQMGTYFTAITDIKVDGRSVKALKTKAFTTQPEGNNYNYLSEFSFDLPSNAMPEKLRGETMVPVSFKVPDTPMGNDYMEARLRFDWGAAVKTKDQDIAGNAEGVSKAQEVYLKDTATGIELLGNTENLSSKAKFNVSVLTSGKDYELAKKAMESVNKSWKLYRLTAVVDGREVSLNGSVQLSIPCGGKEIEVYRISDNGRKIAVKGKVVKNNYVVNTSALGLFAVTEGQGMSQAPAKASSFTDVPAGFWAKDAIELVVSRGLFRGDTATTFQPNGSMSRAMFVTVLGRLANVDNQAVASSKFSDVPASAYYAPYVEWAAKNGIVNGTTATTFTPDQPVTRQEMAVFLTRYAERFSIQLKNEKSVAFADEADIAGFAKEAVRTMAAAGLLNGVGENKFAPNDRSSRAEVAALLARFIKEYSL